MYLLTGSEQYENTILSSNSRSIVRLWDPVPDYSAEGHVDYLEEDQMPPDNEDTANNNIQDEDDVVSDGDANNIRSHKQYACPTDPTDLLASLLDPVPELPTPNAHALSASEITLSLTEAAALATIRRAPWLLSYRILRSKLILLSLRMTLDMSVEDLNRCTLLYPRYILKLQILQNIIKITEILVSDDILLYYS